MDGFPATAFVNRVNRSSIVYSSMHSRAVSLPFESYMLGAACHWQKWSASLFSPWHFEHWTLPRVSNTRISVLGGALVTGIPREIGAIPPDGRKRCYRVLIGRCDCSRHARRVLTRP